MVFKKQFTAAPLEDSPFSSEKRKDYDGANGDDVLISVVVCPEEDTHEYMFVPSTFSFSIRKHHQAKSYTFRRFRDLVNSGYAFILSYGGVQFDVDSRFEASEEQTDFVKRMLAGKSEAKYLVAGDVAISYDEKTKGPILQVVKDAMFTPDGWKALGRVCSHRQQARKLLKAAGRMKECNPRLVVYHQRGEPDEEEESEEESVYEDSDGEEESEDEENILLMAMALNII